MPSNKLSRCLSKSLALLLLLTTAFVQAQSGPTLSSGMLRYADWAWDAGNPPDQLGLEAAGETYRRASEAGRCRNNFGARGFGTRGSRKILCDSGLRKGLDHQGSECQEGKPGRTEGRRAQESTKKAPYSPKHGALSLRLSQGDPMMKGF